MNKSAVCRYFASGGTCFYGNECQFIHGQPDASHSTHTKQMEGTPSQGGLLPPEDVMFASYDLPAESKLQTYINAPRVSSSKDGLTTSLSNLSLGHEAISAAEFVPSSTRGSSSSLNSVPTNSNLAHSVSTSSFTPKKGPPHSQALRDSPENSPVIARRSFMRGPSPLTLNGSTAAAPPDYSTGPGIYQESLGGTTYFYQPPGSEEKPEMAAEGEVIAPTFHLYAGPPAHVEHLKPKANAPSFFMPDELRLDILNRASLLNSRVNADLLADLPTQVDNYHNICPLESQLNKSQCYGYMTSVYKATNMKTGLVYCLRRIHAFRLSSTKSIIEIVDQWKKIQHSNLVQLRELFTTKAFGDNSVIFVYDYFAGAQTLKSVYFNSTNGGSYNGSLNGMSSKIRGSSVGPRLQQDGQLRQGHGLLAESLIWAYVVQLSSALRSIHAANLSLRCLDPSKVLLTSKSRLRLNCAAVVDVLSLDSTQMRAGSISQHYQKEDLAHLGRLVLCLACNSATACQYVENSMDCVAKNYSSDLRNLLLYLLSLPARISSINDIMPMIGARFYTQLDAAQCRSDVLEAELAKEVDNGRLFRLLIKLGSINERPELNLDTTWSETGDRYMLKLFRDYLFHQCTKEGLPWLDMAHIVQSLNKLDAGVDEKICLVSRDEQNVLVVSYSELKRCMDSAFAEIYTKI